MSNEEKLKRVGLNPRFLYTAKGKKLEYIKSLDEDIGIAFKKYIEEGNSVSNKVLMIYYELREKKGQLYAFSRHLNNIKLFKHDRSFYSIIDQLTVNYEDRTISIQKLNKMKKLIEEYDKFKNK
jgi:hypothetical protein